MIVTEETGHAIEIRLVALLARLEERCPQHSKEIRSVVKDVDAAFSRIRKLEKFQAAWLAIAGVVSPVLTAVLIKYVVK